MDRWVLQLERQVLRVDKPVLRVGKQVLRILKCSSEYYEWQDGFCDKNYTVLSPV